MGEAYKELLDATIRHLEELKGRGTSYVTVSPQTLQLLKGTPATLQRPVETVRAPEAPAQRPPARERSFTVPAAPVPRTQPAVGQPMTAPAPKPGKGQAMEALRQRVGECVKCANLAAARKNVVFGVGNLDADLMFVGEAPGADEDRKGEPFVGAAGQVLSKIINAMGLSRETVYIANVLKCRPDMPAGASGNRKPTPEEMGTCIAHLREQIAIIQPRVIVGLGGTALEGLLGSAGGGIMRLRGTWQSYQGIPLMPTYHPAYLLHNPSNTEKRKLWEDMMLVMGKLGMPISEKQRRYFL